MKACLDNNEYEKIDILQFVGNKSYLHSDRMIYFNNKTWPVFNKVKPFECEDNYKSLIICIQESAYSTGMNITGNGSNYLKIHGENILCKKFTCHRIHTYDGNIHERKKKQYRRTTYHNNRKNTRGPEGIKLPRQKNTFRPYTPDQCCKFFLPHIFQKIRFICNS